MILARLEAGGLTGSLATLAEPWAKIYGDFKAVSAGVLFLHLVPLIVAAGAAFMADRDTLRLSRSAPADRERQLRELGSIHRVVLFGLTMSFLSGVLMFLGDVETFLGSIFLWIKLSLVALLLVNGLMMARTEKALATDVQSDALWGRMRTIALMSATLWLLTTLAGVVLKEYA
ncbi:MAG: hypothetical protein ABIT20_24535 [Gemmatimonadaceae bacterium]